MTDWELVKEVQKGNLSAFEMIVEKYKKVIFNMAYRFTHNYSESEDLSQEVFVHCYLQIEKFNNSSKFSTWLYRLATNKCIDWQRKKQQEPFLEQIGDKGKLPDTALTPEGKYIKKEKEKILRDAIDGIPEKYRTVIILYHLQGLNYKEISEILKIPIKTLETQLYRGKKILKEKLYSQGEVVSSELSPNKV